MVGQTPSVENLNKYDLGRGQETKNKIAHGIFTQISHYVCHLVGFSCNAFFCEIPCFFQKRTLVVNKKPWYGLVKISCFRKE